MRFGGIHSRTGGDLAPSLEALRKGIGAERSRCLRTLAFPVDTPRIVILIDPQASPAVGVATGPDGSFAILDGEITEDGAGPEAPDAAARRALDRYSVAGTDALADLDGGFGLAVWDARAETLLLAVTAWEDLSSRGGL